MIGVSGWKLYQRVAFSGRLLNAGTGVWQPGGALVAPSPAGALGAPLPAGLGSVMKIQPVFAGGSCRELTGLPPLGIGPLGHGLARFSVMAGACTARCTPGFVAHTREPPTS